MQSSPDTPWFLQPFPACAAVTRVHQIERSSESWMGKIMHQFLESFPYPWLWQNKTIRSRKTPVLQEAKCQKSCTNHRSQFWEANVASRRSLWIFITWHGLATCRAASAYLFLCYLWCSHTFSATPENSQIASLLVPLLQSSVAVQFPHSVHVNI